MCWYQGRIETGAFERRGRALTNFDRTVPSAQSELAHQFLKDPYDFDFFALGPEMRERDLERGLIEHMQRFLVKLGVRQLLECLKVHEAAPAGLEMLLPALHTMNLAVHGRDRDLDQATINEALRIGNRFLADLEGDDQVDHSG
jgi:hypothetical protein